MLVTFESHFHECFLVHCFRIVAPSRAGVSKLIFTGRRVTVVLEELVLIGRCIKQIYANNK